MTTILVTGGAGYIGSHACKALRAAGFVPVVYDNLSRGHAGAVRWGDLVVGDLGDTACLRQTLQRHRPAAVLHFAAFAHVAESMQQPLDYYRNNVGRTLELLQAMRESEVRHIVFSSSCAVYGIPNVVPITERSPLQPINPYGASKLMCERMLRDCAAAAFPLRWVALRYFNAAGADPKGEIGESHAPETHAIPLLLEAAANPSQPFTINGHDYPTADGTCIRDYIHVSDLADAHVAALRLLLQGGESGAINIGTGRGWSVRELVEIAGRITGVRIPTRSGPRRVGDPPVLVSEVSLARERLQWKPNYPDVEQQIIHAWAWWQQVHRNDQSFSRAESYSLDHALAESARNSR
jgi:UDP-glucose-4-epimerase GalE